MAKNWQVGDRIKNRWEIHDIKRGGMGVVYIVYDHEWKEAFAAKTFQDEVFARNPATANWFTQEALTWINLDLHQNITQARFVENIEGKPFLFLEYVSGGDLSRWIGTPRLTEDLPQVLRFAIQFCDGMIHATAKGVKAHRDIKPQNCLVTEDGTLKITDFGLAKVFDDSSFSLEQGTDSVNIFQSHTGMGAGTPPFMAPEQFLDAKHVDVRADIYSFGIMLYLMATGRLPFITRSFPDWARLHMTASVPRLQGDFQLLDVVVHACLEKDPLQRPESFDVVRNLLNLRFAVITRNSIPSPRTGTDLLACDWNNKGLSLHRLGKHHEALDCFHRALGINPSFPEALNNQGLVSESIGFKATAVLFYDQALAHNPACVEAWVNKGNWQMREGRYEDALLCYRQASIHAPKLATSWVNMGLAQEAMGRDDDALSSYDRALSLDPQDDGDLLNKGVLLLRYGEYTKAADCFNSILETNPRDGAAWTNKGLALEAIGDRTGALSCHNYAIEMDDKNAVAWNNKGTILGNLGQLADALRCFEQAHRLGHPEAAGNIAACRSRSMN